MLNISLLDLIDIKWLVEKVDDVGYDLSPDAPSHIKVIYDNHMAALEADHALHSAGIKAVESDGKTEKSEA